MYTLIPEKVETTFDPNMNGHYENIQADNGNVYTGDFVDGYYEGEGKVTYTDGSTYEGEWKAGKRNGTGVYTSTTGWTYSGEWVDDVNPRLHDSFSIMGRRGISSERI